MRRTQGGFTLIELMITVAIVGIIVAVALPNYTKHIARGNRSAAQSFMVQVASRQEQAMLNARSYFSIPTGTSAEWAARNINLPSEVSGNYTVTVTMDTTTTVPNYVITAAPRGRQATNDASCGSLTYNQKGEKGITGSGTVANCWK